MRMVMRSAPALEPCKAWATLKWHPYISMAENACPSGLPVLGRFSNARLDFEAAWSCRDQQVLEKKALKSQEAASAREADMGMERDRQMSILAFQVIHISH